ncbi:MAG: hypothetical protein WC291_03695 [Thermodesulfovibrionales bacterium]
MERGDVVAKCNALKTSWSARNARFKEWYRLIEMVDDLKQEKMESFVSNDPQSCFKLLRHMLDQKVPHRVPQELLTNENQQAASQLSTMFERMWWDVEQRYKRTGREGWGWDFIGYLLATGWYSVFATMSLDGTQAIAEIWNPSEVYPLWGDELVECAHITRLSPSAARRMIARNKWSLEESELKSGPELNDLWWLDENNAVHNAVVIGKALVKADTVETRFTRIPIHTGPAGGLPDTGSISGGRDTYQKEIGQSVVATNENVYRYWNKWWTFNMQHLRDIVQARIVEKNRSGKPIVKPEQVFTRGAIFRMTPDEDVYFLSPPPMPVELRTTMLDMEAMMQRGGPAWSMFGSIQGQMTAYVMSQISASTDQVAKPYHRAIMDCMTGIDNFWLEQIVKFRHSPHGMKLPQDLPPEFYLEANYEIRIPGDIIQRATVGRMLNPNFELSYNRVIEEVFPEVKNPMQEKAMLRAEEAARNPVHAVIAFVVAAREEADLLRKSGNTRAAQLYEAAAQRAEAQITGTQVEEEARNNAIGNRTEALPPEGTTSAPAPVV